MKFPNFLIERSAGSEREEFPVCPKDEHYPKCKNCNSLLSKGNCDLGRDGPKPGHYKYRNIFFSTSDSEELSPEQAKLIASLESGIVVKPVSKRQISRRGKSLP